jgi:thiol-disulfide isomerase/thioredoxin
VNRRSVLGLVLVAVLVVSALYVGNRSEHREADKLPGLRERAALQACPSSLGPVLPKVTLRCLGTPGEVPLDGAAPRRPTVLNVWATWCRPCVLEVPVLVDFAGRAAGKVDVVGVLMQDTAANGLEFARQFGMHYPSVVDDDGRVLRRYGSKPPITLLLDAQGRVAHVERGQIHSAAELDALVAQHLRVTV